MKQLNNNYKDWIMGWQYKKDAPYDFEWQEDRRKRKVRKLDFEVR